VQKESAYGVMSRTLRIRRSIK